MTDRVRFIFRTKEYASGTPWIVLEPLQKDLDVLCNGFLGLDLPEGTTLKRAEEIAEFLNENITSVSYTKHP